MDQEHNWCPTVLNNGRVLYLRWEYADLPHAHSRRLFHMNPDGTGQMEYLSSNSYFPNSFFYARPIPGEPTMVVGIATGHHGNARTGRLLVIDPAQGRHEADRGWCSEIPGWGKKVEPLIRDPLADGVWPQFLHPYPLEREVLPGRSQAVAGVAVGHLPGRCLRQHAAAARVARLCAARADSAPADSPRRPSLPTASISNARTPWSICRTSTVARARRASRGARSRSCGWSPIISATAAWADCWGAIGMDGPWDIKRVLGTVPVEEDGSALFRVPANTPITVQPLDAEGQALQLMRSWFTAMPGESLSCVGCHESQNSGTPNRQRLAARRPAVRNYSLVWSGSRVRFCARGAAGARPLLRRVVTTASRQPDGDGDRRPPRRQNSSPIGSPTSPGMSVPAWEESSRVSYGDLHRFVRRPGIESDIHLLAPMEFHAETTELVQLLRKGHYGVELDAEAWDRLITWIDLNAPYHGTWSEIVGEPKRAAHAQRKRELLQRYAGVDDEPEAIPAVAVLATPSAARVARRPEPHATATNPTTTSVRHRTRVRKFPRRPPAVAQMVVDLGEGVNLELVRIPAGGFAMGDSQGPADAQPTTAVTIERDFWMGRFEVTNAEYARFDARHDSHFETMHGYQFGIHGYPLNGPQQPVVRVSWNSAVQFCDGSVAQSGRKFSLPTEAQWEYACRAGTTTQFSYGDLDADFSQFANFGDARLREFALQHLYASPGSSEPESLRRLGAQRRPV